MPRFFFDVHRDGATASATEEQELPDLIAAHEEAFTSARQIVASSLLNGSSLKGALRGLIAVKDEGGDLLFTVSFMQGVKMSTKARPLTTAAVPVYSQ